eukprot:4991223-Amphidinium_carterae.1
MHTREDANVTRRHTAIGKGHPISHESLHRYGCMNNDVFAATPDIKKCISKFVRRTYRNSCKVPFGKFSLKRHESRKEEPLVPMLVKSGIKQIISTL